jgi:hypothetical protein
MKYLIIFFAFLFSTELVAQQVHDSLLVASLERTTCYGKCPYYKINVYINGVVTLEGKRNVEHIGLYRANISTRKVFQLLEKAYQVDYMNLANKYPERGIGLIDFPTCITYVKINKEEKIIYNRNDSPRQLLDYEQFFDSIFEDVKWEKLAILPSE